MMSVVSVDEASAAELLAIGNISEARRRLAQAVRDRPADQPARMFLFQLLCVEGEWEKARAQLRALAELSPEAQMLAAAYGQAIEGEQMRARVFAGEERARLLVDGPAWATGLVSAVEDGSRDFAALDDCPDTPGEVDGQSFAFLFDGDTRFGPMFEAIVAGRWGMVPFAMVEEISTEGPVDLRDLVWLPAEIRFRQGPALAAMLPVRYPGAEREPEGALRLARMTEWREAAGLIQGIGQRVWTTSEGEDVGILSFRSIRFVDPS